MSDAAVFEGEERLEPFPATGAPMRMGAPAHLNVPDRERIRAALTAGDTARALACLDAVFHTHRFIMLGFTEWCLQMPQTLATCTQDRWERVLTHKALALWREETASLRACPVSTRAVDLLHALFPHEALAPGAADAHRQKLAAGEATVADRVLAEMVELRDSIRAAAGTRDCAAATARLETYFAATLARHDAFTQLTSSYPTTVLRAYGQEVAERVTDGSFAGCSFYGPLFALAASLSPRMLAAFFAEHLRSHLSGPGRQGATRIVEEEDRYRLVFEPCGSGGALRLRLRAACGRGPDPLPEASPVTWHRQAEVPAYCSHCAMNELKLVRMVGYPAWVTEFDPDPARPCGWTMYKDPERIPESYFTRLGVRRDPAKFKRKS